MKEILALLAHNDDEFFIAPLLRQEITAGNRITIVYLTHGSFYGVQSETRVEESRRVLQEIGVPPERVHYLGLKADIFDGALVEHAEMAYQKLKATLTETTIDQILVIAWEGGHPDHDACNSIGLAFAQSRGLSRNIFEFPAYNAYRRPFGLFRVMSFPEGGQDAIVRKIGLRDATWAIGLAFSYPSQRRTFVGLLPGSIGQFVLGRRQVLRVIPANRDYYRPPHPGRLFYERRFGISFEQFLGRLRPFLHEHMRSDRTKSA